MSGTHTYATLEVSRETFNEIWTKLHGLGYGDSCEVHPGRLLIDMNGLALTLTQKESAT